MEDLFNFLTSEKEETTTFNSEKYYAVSKTAKILIYYYKVVNYVLYSELHRYSGYINGKITEKITQFNIGKNLNKTNSTTHYEQALLEGKSKLYNKEKDGYKTINKYCDLYNIDKTYINNNFKSDKERIIWITVSKRILYNTDVNNRIKPMLAEKYKDYPLDFNKVHAYIQPKINGVRCLSFNENKQIIQLSREGIEYKTIQIRKDLEKLELNYPDFNNYVFDGELYAHGHKLEDIVSYVKLPLETITVLTYEVYDILPKNGNLEFYKRLQLLTRFQKVLNDLKITTIKIVETQCIYNEEEMYKIFQQHLNQNFEGSIVRNSEEKYWFGFRHKALLKLKSSMSEDFEIVNVSLKNNIKSDFCWVCKTNENKLFEVKPHGTFEKRRELYDNYKQYIGKRLQLTFHEYTHDKIPFHITEVLIRDYE